MDRGSEIADYFSGRSVFITGVTGFLGKALVEKLLRSCPDVQNIYVLVRPKRDCEGKYRVEQLLNCPLFQVLKSGPKTANAASKVIPIAGDMTQPGLGISPEDANLLAETVSVVIHSAATVKFDETLKKSIKLNVEGTKKVLDLARTMRNLSSIVHVSTAYSNCERPDIREIIYPINVDPNNAIHTFDWMPEDLVETITPKILGKKPNTYTYTKHLAEQLVHEARLEGFPACIVRPSIVAATYEDPIPGWVDNMNGPSGIFVACGSGVLRSLLCYDSNKLDVIPLDHVVSLIISAAWYTATCREKSVPDMEVFNCCSGSDNPFYLKKAVPWALNAFWKRPFSRVLWYPNPYLATSPTINYINNIVLHLLPAHLIDGYMKLRGEKPFMMFIYNKVRAGVLALRFFCTNEWNFSTDNTKTLYSLMKPQDQKMFKFNIRDVDWETYTENYLFGLRKYTLKDDDNGIPAARKKVRKLYVYHRATQALSIMLAVFLVGFLILWIISLF